MRVPARRCRRSWRCSPDLKRFRVHRHYLLETGGFMRSGRFVFLIALCLAVVSCRTSRPAPGVHIDLTDHSGLVPKPLDRLEAGDSLTLGLDGLRPKSRVELHLN